MSTAALDNSLSRSSNVSKLERLNCRVVKLLTAAVQEVLEAVRETVSEYQEKTARTQRENESSNVSKLERLNCRVVKLLTAAVQEVLEAVRETVSEYQEKTARTQRENERLRLKLQEALNNLEKEREVSRLASISLSINRPSSETQMRPGAQHVSRMKQDSVVKADAEPEAVCDLQVALTLPDKSTPRTEQVNTSDLDCTIKGTEPGTCASDASSCVDIKTEPIASECSQQEQQVPQVVVTMGEGLRDQTTRQDNISSRLYIQSNLSTLGRARKWTSFVETRTDTTQTSPDVLV
ncbi:hypothetical protein AMELA_G00108310 [Ameiurus melas]|uniref:Uncharacterized protein n=1 Tax=Ameiurus melas TaxID=219545 RepID=A0A7J6ARI6_AMEME|nr:hypothetical protein AMELA_G00108310 [Ameiurus melas]